MTSGILTRIALTTCLALAAATLGAQQLKPADVAKRRAEIQIVLNEYMAGDRENVAKRVPSDPLTRAAIRNLLTSDAPWHPARAAFALEIAALSRTRDGAYFDASMLVRNARQMLERRPTPIGGNPDEDRFELLCHQIGLAIIEHFGFWPDHRLYLTEASPRLVKLEASYPSLAQRLPMMRAVDAAMYCCARQLVRGGVPVATVVNVSGQPRPVPTPPPNSDYAILLFENAARIDALRQEAFVRAAFLRERLGHAAQGLALLDRTESRGDRLLDYASALIRASLLERLGRDADAAQSYAEAMKQASAAQVPVIGYATALLRAGRVEDAAAAAELARRMPLEGADPWPAFLRADARFVDPWIAQMRMMLK